MAETFQFLDVSVNIFMLALGCRWFSVCIAPWNKYNRRFKNEECEREQMPGSIYAQILPCDFDGLPAWEIIADSGAKAVVTQLGATLISWEPKPGKNVIDGYHNAAELRQCIASRSRVLAPWPGRVKDGSYVFDGERYQLEFDANGEAIHGLVQDLDFAVVAKDTALVLAADCPGGVGYPWPFRIEVTFSLENGADGVEHLSVVIAATNTGAQDIPLALGWHPYLRIPDQEVISNCELEIPARTKILVDGKKIPLAGEAAYAGVQAPVKYAYVGNTEIDDSFRGLVPDEDGVATTFVRSLSSTQQIKVSQEPISTSVMHVFTADDLPRDSRKSFALEPLSNLPDAFNRADSMASVRLRPGGVKTISATLSYSE
ncbi:aldose 1-epimerase [Arcanobacterium hippocoleae]|uniref:Aldose 1-epimerase n=2 Tax=Arcanobacterium hippocoleae TaxID=149017 RepID=A0ABU1T0X9_9ACTO|nr:aldose 1-epimerase [Arcanobacterium hippocoleae]MDR6938944.1 aldose 1-epimerase [Arcanobacterium hippocoleae]